MRPTFIALAGCLLITAVAQSYFELCPTDEALTSAGQAFLASLDEQQRSTAQLPYDTPKRVDWHFIPKDQRKGLQLKDMTESQKKAAHSLLKSVLSQLGYSKATQIMGLEKLLYALEGEKRTNIRDPERYYFTVFGKPETDGKWGLSVEGHHLSLNFVVESDHLIATTPQVFCTNPAIVKNESEVGIPVGTRVLEKEETLAFDLVNSLEGDQVQHGIISEKAPAEVRNAGKPEPPQAAPEGIRYADLNGQQQQILVQLIEEYAHAMPEAVSRERMEKINDDGLMDVHFAWAGATEPGIGHYYKIQGESFLIEFVNTQPDAAGNPANHIHSIWRDPHGDFAIPIAK